MKLPVATICKDEQDVIEKRITSSCYRYCENCNKKIRKPSTCCRECHKKITHEKNRSYCIDCGKEKFPDRKKLRCRECWKIYNKKHPRIGALNPMFGKIKEKNHNWKGGVTQQIYYCKICKVHKIHYHTFKYGKGLCAYCKHVGKPKGKHHHSWKGGLTPLVQSIRNLSKYRQWRADVFRRDDYTCQECHKRGGYLEAHHIVWFVDLIRKYRIKNNTQALVCEHLWHLDNGVTLCKNCHSKTKYVRKLK